MNKKEQWKDDILSSLDDIQRAIPDEVLLSQIMEKLPKNTLTTAMPRWQLRWAAVAACLLVALNVYVFFASDNKLQEATLTTDYVALLSDYSLYQ